MSSKSEHVKNIQEAATSISNARYLVQALRTSATKNGWESGGSDEIKDVDTEPQGFTGSEYNEALEVLEDFIKFMDNEPVPQKDRQKAVDRVKKNP